MDDELRDSQSFVCGGQLNGWDIRLGAAQQKSICVTVQNNHNVKIPLRVILSGFLGQPLGTLNSDAEFL